MRVRSPGLRGGRRFVDCPVSGGTVGASAGSLTILAAVLEAGRETRAALPLTALAFQLFNATSGRGDGAADDSQVIRAYRALNGAA